MRQVLLVFLIFVASPLFAEKPTDIQINVTGMFDANIILSGTFTASGVLDEMGSFVDSPRYTGNAVHVSRLLTTLHGEYITLEMIFTHVATPNTVPPDWCPPLPTPDGTLLFFQEGSWKVVSGTGPYALLKGNGSRAGWALLDSTSFVPVAAKECLKGTMKNEL